MFYFALPIFNNFSVTYPMMDFKVIILLRVYHTEHMDTFDLLGLASQERPVWRVCQKFRCRPEGGMSGSSRPVEKGVDKGVWVSL